jgi:Protein of unknown function (DUF1236)
MTNRFLISVAAAALIAGTGFANAQGVNREGGGAAGGGSTVQQGAPSERGAPSAAPINRDSAPSGIKAGEPAIKGAQTDKMEGGKAKSAQDTQPGQKSQQNTVSDTDRAKGGKDMKAEGREGKTVGQAPESKDSMSKDSAQSKEGMSKDQPSKDRMNAETKGGVDSKSQTTTTTGQAGAGAKLSTEQQTKISTVIRSQRVEPVTNVNFSISVGTRVPRDVRFHRLPTEVVTIYPEWRGYEFILVRNQILVIDPRTYEIVAILDA